jgi:hypothetical protein
VTEAITNTLFAMLLLLGLVFFFVGFVLAPLIVLAVGYALFNAGSGRG